MNTFKISFHSRNLNMNFSVVFYVSDSRFMWEVFFCEQPTYEHPVSTTTNITNPTTLFLMDMAGSSEPLSHIFPPICGLDICNAHLKQRTFPPANVHVLQFHCYFMVDATKRKCFYNFFYDITFKRYRVAWISKTVAIVPQHYTQMALAADMRSYITKLCTSLIECDENLLKSGTRN